MINALFSSKINGTKAFQRNDKISFGWITVDDMYTRELVHAQQNQTRMIPRLNEMHCLQDAWTKLNVLPAKIIQVCNALVIIYSYDFIRLKNLCTSL